MSAELIPYQKLSMGLSAAQSSFAITQYLYRFGCWTRSHTRWASKEDKMRKDFVEMQRDQIVWQKRVIALQRAQLDAKEALYACLSKNINGKKDEDGLPCACCAESAAYETTWGPDAFNQVRTEYAKRLLNRNK